MKKTNLQLCISSLLLFITFYSFSQVTTTLSNIQVNNSTSTGITFNSTSTITAKFDVNLLTYDGSSGNILGNIHIYVKKNATSLPIQVGWSPITFSVNYPPFVPQETYTNKTPFTVELIKSEFFASGGILYAEYKNNNGGKFKSSNINIIGGTAVVPPGPDPGNPSNPGGLNPLNPYMEITKVRYAETNEVVEDITGYSYLQGANAYGTLGHLYVFLPKNKLSVKLNVDFEINKGPGVTSFTLCDRFITWGGQALVGWPKLPCTEYTATVYGTLPIDITNENKSFLLKANLTNPQSGLVVHVESIEFLNTDIFLIYNGRGENSRITSIGSGITKVIIGEVLDERRGIKRPLYGDIDQIKWFKRTVGGIWAFDGISAPDINTITQPTEFFKRSFYKGSWVDSNVVLINPQPPIVGTDHVICCDQNLIYGTAPAIIIGNVPNVGLVDYIWQYKSRSDFSDIPGATGKDYTPQQSTGYVSYRRIAISRYNPADRYISNVIYIAFSNGSRTKSDVFFDDDSNNDDKYINKAAIYPNPTSSILYINGYEIESSKVKMFDITGRQIDLNRVQQHDNLIEIDISNLPNATYLLSIESSNGTIYKKIIKN